MFLGAFRSTLHRFGLRKLCASIDFETSGHIIAGTVRSPRSGKGTVARNWLGWGELQIPEDTVKYPIEEAIRQLEAELSLLKAWLPNRGSAHSLGKSSGVGRALSRKLQPGLTGTSPSQASPAKPKADV